MHNLSSTAIKVELIYFILYYRYNLEFYVYFTIFGHYNIHRSTDKYIHYAGHSDRTDRKSFISENYNNKDLARVL